MKCEFHGKVSRDYHDVIMQQVIDKKYAINYLSELGNEANTTVG